MGHDHDPDQVIRTALFAAVVASGELLKAVRGRMAPSISMDHAELVAAVQEAREERERKSKVYKVDQWEVGPYTRLQNGKEVKVRGYVASPRKESDGKGA